MKSHGNPKYINLSVIAYTNDAGDSLFNYTLSLNVMIVNYMGNFALSIPRYENDREYQNQIFQSTVNFCKLDDGVRGNFLIKMFMEEFYKTSNYNLKCPLEPGTKNIRNMKVTENFFPEYLLRLIGDTKFLISLRSQGKVLNEKSLKYLYSLKFYGEMKRS